MLLSSTLMVLVGLNEKASDRAEAQLLEEE
jgi:hypothetical protein